MCPLSLPIQAIEFNLYEEAFEIYKKFGKKVNAIQVLINNLQDLDRAHEYANKVSCQAPRVQHKGRCVCSSTLVYA